MQLGDAIRAARVRKGLRQEDLGAALPSPVHAKTVSKWERGLAVPRGQLTALEHVLDVRLTNRQKAAPSDPSEMSNDELAAQIMRLVAEMTHRLRPDGGPMTSLDAETVLSRGWTSTRRSATTGTADEGNGSAAQIT